MSRAPRSSARGDVFDSPQIEANGFMAEVEYPGVGRTSMIDTPVRLSGRPGGVGDRAPDAGRAHRTGAEKPGLFSGEDWGARGGWGGVAWEKSESIIE